MQKPGNVTGAGNPGRLPDRYAGLLEQVIGTSKADDDNSHSPESQIREGNFTIGIEENDLSCDCNDGKENDDLHVNLLFPDVGLYRIE